MTTTTSRRRPVATIIAMLLLATSASAFTATSLSSRSTATATNTQTRRLEPLNVWFFGGSDSENNNKDSCELVAVRIERTSSNSRRIWGEIVIPGVPMDQVWRILTDYNNLSTHVPNLVESRITESSSASNIRPGSGTYSCKLFQKGAQKIIGFEFGASLTMKMQEVISTPAQRLIQFNCIDSFFFNNFDGEWRVTERINIDTNQIETVLLYVVDVRPKGPVPVSALEWRIREDVPTNLRAVKSASILLKNREMATAPSVETPALVLATSAPPSTPQPVLMSSRNSVVNGAAKKVHKLAFNLRQNMQWDKDETMAAYLKD